MKRYILLILTSLSLGIVNAQEEPFATGLLPDDGRYEQQPRKAELLTRDYKVLPSKYSLIQYCPTAKSQGDYGTCTSWATTYAARTIAEAVSYGWTDKEKITNEAFSPIFVYAQIKGSNDTNCQKGAHISDAMKLMKNKGVVKYSSFNVMCASYINSELMQAAARYKIDDYFTLFSITCSNANEKIQKVKKAISEDCPVAIAMWLPKSFFKAGNTWNVTDVNFSKHDYHAMCVIGYDDQMNGGSFQIMNSWGASWGNKGFVWVRYSDFARFVDQAYEIYVKKRVVPQPDPQPVPQPKPQISLSGEITLQLSTGEQMLPQWNQNKAAYVINGDYISGTRYRIYISNNEPAYVYVIGSDLANNVSKVFPPRENISAALTYKSNHIAIPDETFYVEMDNTKGTDYMCVLYSKDKLDINSIISQIKISKGSFYEKVQSTLSNQVVPVQDVHYVMNKIGFSSKSEKTVVPVIIEMKHI